MNSSRLKIPKTPIASTISARQATIHQSTVAVAATTTTQKIVIQKSVFDAMPDSGYVRESQLVQSPKRPGIPVPLPFSAPTLWRKVKAGTFPKPIKLSERVTAFKVGDVRAWLTAQAAA